MIDSSTIWGNVALDGTGEEFVGGGIWIDGGGTLRNTIVAGNRSNFGESDLAGTFLSRGYNLIGSSRGGSGYRETDLLDVPALLGPLRDNGGPTPTHALLSGSPAVNAGDPDFVPPPETDQRGFPRVVGDRLDIGAYEQQKPRPPVRAEPLSTQPFGFGFAGRTVSGDLAAALVSAARKEHPVQGPAL